MSRGIKTAMDAFARLKRRMGRERENSAKRARHLYADGSIGPGREREQEALIYGLCMSYIDDEIEKLKEAKPS